MQNYAVFFLNKFFLAKNSQTRGLMDKLEYILDMIPTMMGNANSRTLATPKAQSAPIVKRVVKELKIVLFTDSLTLVVTTKERS